ncbi:electron transport protein SCO1/SenC [Bacillus sp. SA1-12]|uniref:SCO family protein n=1 Tax=Bacillus sp. SA1-12 TaxID=1455638 RepID=UPI0006261C6D|nr:SCO family protein [Bacillus sp. SA1-12]KKI92662.1 electron transport protein SCO1/SenC [Bacillus sp. SA1-12]
MKKQRWLIILLVSLAGFAIIYWFWPHGEKLPVLDKVEAFQLDDVHGQGYELSTEKIKLVSFFYTNCPDICPLTMADFKVLQDQLKSQGLFGKKVDLVAITIDPEHDTSQIIKDYADSFGADTTGWKWLRGSPEKTKEIAANLQMQYQKLEGDFFAHSTTMFLIDKQNQIRALYDMANQNKPIEKERIIKDIQLLTK